MVKIFVSKTNDVFISTEVGVVVMEQAIPCYDMESDVQGRLLLFFRTWSAG